MKRRIYFGIAGCIGVLVFWFVASLILGGLFFSAIESRNAETVASFLKFAPWLVHRTDGFGETALILAVEHADHETAKILVKAGSDLNFEGRRVGMPLHTAAYFGDTAMMQILLDAGADLSAEPVYVSTNSRGTPLHAAASGGKADAVKLLIERGAKVNTIDRLEGDTPLVKAVWAEPRSRTRALAVRYLIEAGADVRTVGSVGKTPLQLARDYAESNSHLDHGKQRYPELVEIVAILEKAEGQNSGADFERKNSP